MPYPATGDPTVAFVDAVKTRLTADATLMALITGVFSHLSEAARTNYPYVVLGQRHHAGDAGAMQTPGGHVSLQIDTWSNAKGPFQASNIQSRIYVLLERVALTVTGFVLVEGSLTREFAEVFDEPDEDSPDRLLYHGVQRWVAEIHQS
jgi:hypothetical protein